MFMKFNIFPWRSIRTRVTLTLIFFLVGIWLLEFYAGRMLREDMQQVLGEQQFSTVSVIAAHINTAFVERMRTLENVAAGITPAILGDRPSIQTFLEGRRILPMMFNGGLYITRLNGTVIADVPISMGRIGVNYMDRDYIIDALKGKSTISKPVIGKKTHAPAIVMSTPIRDTSGKVIGVLAGGINLAIPNFLDKITDRRYGRTGRFLIVAPQHQLIITATDKRLIMRKVSAPGTDLLIDRFVHGYEGFGILVNPVGIKVLASAKGIPVSGWYVAAALPTEEAFAPISAMQRRMVLASIFLTLLVCGLTWWILKRQLAPIFTTIHTLSTLSDTNTPLPITRQDEVGELIGGFNRLLGTLRQREEALRESEQAARRLAREHAVIAEVGRIIGSTLNIDEVYERFAEQVREVLPVDAITINLINMRDNTRTIQYHAGIHIKGRNKGDVVTMKGGAISKEVVRTRSSLLFNVRDKDELLRQYPGPSRAGYDIGDVVPWSDSASEGMVHTRSSLLFKLRGNDRLLRQYPGISLSAAAGIQSRMIIPLILKDEVFGTLHIRSVKPNAYREYDLRFAERVGTQIVGAIANAQLFLEREQAEKERKRLEELLHRSEKMEALGILAGGVAHDLNNVLGVLMGYSELLVEKIPEGDKLRLYIDNILESTQKGATIIEDLLTLARRGVTVSQPLNLNDIVSGFLKSPVFERLRSFHPHVSYRTELTKVCRTSRARRCIWKRR
jgi:signal transduction histidine kinase